MMIGGGEVTTESILWTNSSPTSTFAAQGVTLSDAISNYDDIRIYIRQSTSSATDGWVTYSAEKVKTFVQTSDTPISVTGVRNSSANKSLGRCMYYTDDTHLQFGSAFIFGGNNTTDNTYVIPTKICGLKKSGESGTINYANPDVTSAGTIAASSSVNVSTTQKAKLIIVETNQKTSTDNQLRNLFVFETDKGGSRVYVNPSGTKTVSYFDSTGTGSAGGGFSVTNNQVTFTQPNSSQAYYTMSIYY